MARFTSFEELQTHLQKRIDRSLQVHVAPIVARTLHWHAKAAGGVNSRSEGGLGDKRSITSDVDAGLLSVRNEARPGPSVWSQPRTPYDPVRDIYGTLFSEWVNNGLWLDLTGYKKSGYTAKPKRAARPFVDTAAHEVNQSGGQIVAALRRGL